MKIHRRASAGTQGELLRTSPHSGGSLASSHPAAAKRVLLHEREVYVSMPLACCLSLGVNLLNAWS